MTLYDMARLTIFLAPIILGVALGKEAGVLVGLIGFGVGMVVGGSAAYALRKTVELSDKIQSPMLQRLIDSLYLLSIVFFLIAAFLSTGILMHVIVEQMTG